eukprot:scaffold2846_cov322-Pavlova_lutheri.AAC.28
MEISRFNWLPLWDERHTFVRGTGRKERAPCSFLSDVATFLFRGAAAEISSRCNACAGKRVSVPPCPPFPCLPTSSARRGSRLRTWTLLARTCGFPTGRRGREASGGAGGRSTSEGDRTIAARDGACQVLSATGRAGTRVNDPGKVPTTVHATRGMPRPPEADRKRRTVAQVAAPAVCEDEPIGVRTRRKKVREGGRLDEKWIEGPQPRASCVVVEEAETRWATWLTRRCSEPV